MMATGIYMIFRKDGWFSPFLNQMRSVKKKLTRVLWRFVAIYLSRFWKEGNSFVNAGT